MLSGLAEVDLVVVALRSSLLRVRLDNYVSGPEREGHV